MDSKTFIKVGEAFFEGYREAVLIEKAAKNKILNALRKWVLLMCHESYGDPFEDSDLEILKMVFFNSIQDPLHPSRPRTLVPWEQSKQKKSICQCGKPAEWADEYCQDCWEERCSSQYWNMIRDIENA